MILLGNLLNMFNLSTPYSVSLRQLLLASVLASCLTSCASNYQFESNIEPDKVKQAFMPSIVNVYPSVNALPEQHRFISLVEGESCQKTTNEPPATEAQARTDARRQALAMNANAVVFTGCVEVPDEQCQHLMVCYGASYTVKEVK